MSKPRLLVVDDEEYIRFALRRWFENCGFEVDLAEDGDVAVAKCRTSSYDVITMDLVMPRMNGQTAIRSIRSFNATVPIIVLTAYQERAGDLSSVGATRILAKPLALHDLEDEVRRVLPASAKRPPETASGPNRKS